MKYSELIQLNLIGNKDLPVEIISIEDLNDGLFAINDKVPIQIVDINNKYNQDDPIELWDEEENEIGLIYFCKSETPELVSSLNEWKFISYLFEVEESNFLSEDYEFKYSYLLLEKEHFSLYMREFFNTAPLWGSFSHKDVFPEPYKKPLTRVKVIRELEYPTTVHRDNSLRALKQHYAFERYLKLYHHIELLFDKDLLEKIKRLNENNLTELGVLLKSFDNGESKRVLSVMKDRCSDVDSICKSLNLIDNYKDISKKIFFDFGKKGDPLDGDFTLLESILMESGGFTEENCRKHLAKGKMNNRDKFEEFILTLASYWIYRIRCSIAHNKVGEYILSHSEEEFVFEFGETLINSVVLQVLKKRP